MKKTGFVVFAVMLSACSQSFENVRIGMNKADVVRTIGRPDQVIAANTIDNNMVEVLEYRQGDWWWGNLDENYWFYFSNDTLEKWGRPGDHLRYVE